LTRFREWGDKPHFWDNDDNEENDAAIFRDKPVLNMKAAVIYET
jgi:hypothetical protein